MLFLKRQRNMKILLLIVGIFFVLSNITFFLIYRSVSFENNIVKRNIINTKKCDVTYSGYSTAIVNHVLRRMVIDTKHKLSWCPIYKAASTVWMKGFAELGGLINSRTKTLVEKGIVQWKTLARKAFPVDHNTNAILSKLNQTKTFLIVRHPLERLLAVYRDKFENKRNFNPKWSLQNYPTFEQFLTFILKDNNMILDEQWIPMYLQCLTCYFRYDYIIKTDTFYTDTNLMLKELEIDLDISSYPPEKVNKQGKTDRKVTRHYYSNVSRSILEILYDSYYPDFDMFDYSPAINFEIDAPNIVLVH